MVLNSDSLDEKIQRRQTKDHAARAAFVRGAHGMAILFTSLEGICISQQNGQPQLHEDGLGTVRPFGNEA